MLIGLVGKPSCGKSSFFKASTLIDVKIAAYAFTTIEPNRGVAYVTAPCPCKELGVECNPQNSQCINGTRLIPTELLDVAGLVPGSHAGRGKGNKFLNDLIRGDLLIHIVDASGKTDAEGNATEGYDPSNDVRFLEEEIDLWFKSVIERNLAKIKDKGRAEEVLAGLGIRGKHVEQAIEKVGLEPATLAKELRLLSKPIIIAANKIDIGTSGENYKIMKEKFPEKTIVPCSAEAEIALRQAAKSGLIKYVPGSNSFDVSGELSAEQKNALDFIRKRVLEKFGSTGIQKCLNTAVFDFLKYIAVYPVENESKFSNKKGQVLPDVFLMPSGSTARDLAYKVHTDIGKAFIGAVDARTKKRVGADYELKNNDIIKIQSAAR